MIRRGSLLVALLLCAPVWADAEKPEENGPQKPEPGVKIETFEGGRRADAVLPGPLIGFALPRTSTGRREILLLTHTTYAGLPEGDDEASDDESGPCEDRTEQSTALYHLQYDGPNPTLGLLRDDLPGDATSLDAMDVDGDGVEELLLYRPGELHLLRELGGRIGGSGPELLLADPDIRHQAREPAAVRRIAQLDEPWLQLPGIGRVRYLRPDSVASWTLAAEAELPVHAIYRTNQFQVHSSSPFLLGRPGGETTFAIRAETFGTQRLRVLLLRPEAGPEQSVVEECWAQLPTPERVMHQFTGLLDGEPVLLVTSMPANKLSLFDEQLLRIFPLKRDRSRTGRPPRVAFKTRINNINRPVPFLFDLDGDGREDLVLGYWKGFEADRIVLDVYLQHDDGSFPASPKTTGLDVEDADSSVLLYGRDLDGDERADLMLLAGEKLLIFRGSVTMSKGKSVVEKTPAYSAPVGHAVDGGERIFTVGPGASQFTSRQGWPPRPIDLDGDGRSEVLLVRPDQGQISVVLFEE